MHFSNSREPQPKLYPISYVYDIYFYIHVSIFIYSSICLSMYLLIYCHFIDFVCVFIFEFTCFLSLCFVSIYIFGCIPAFPLIKSSTKSAPCILFEYKRKLGRDIITTLLVYGDWSTLDFGERKRRQWKTF